MVVGATSATAAEPISRRAAARNIHASGDSVNPRCSAARNDDNTGATTFLRTDVVVVSIGLGAGVTMVGAVETESCVAVMVPVAGALALISEAGGATPSSAVVLRPEVRASVDGVGRGAGADEILVSDGIPLLRNPLCDGEVAGAAVVSDWSDASAWPAVPSVGSSSAFDTVSWVDD
jgi:hypothetical protein